MIGNSHVRFLGEGREAILKPYPTKPMLLSRLCHTYLNRVFYQDTENRRLGVPSHNLVYFVFVEVEQYAFPFEIICALSFLALLLNKLSLKIPFHQ